MHIMASKEKEKEQAKIMDFIKSKQFDQSYDANF